MSDSPIKDFEGLLNVLDKRENIVAIKTQNPNLPDDFFGCGGKMGEDEQQADTMDVKVLKATYEVALSSLSEAIPKCERILAVLSFDLSLARKSKFLGTILNTTSLLTIVGLSYKTEYAHNLALAIIAFGGAILQIVSDQLLTTNYPKIDLPELYDALGSNLVHAKEQVGNLQIYSNVNVSSMTAEQLAKLDSLCSDARQTARSISMRLLQVKGTRAFKK